jgi:hypothetical protein
MIGPVIPLWSALSPEGSISASPDVSKSCLSYASVTRPTRARISGTQSAPDSATSRGLGSCKLRSPHLSAMKSRDPKTHLESRENLFVD